MKVTNIRKIKSKKLIGGSLPDIDTDFEASRRQDVKAYMERRFGYDQVASVGTVTTLKLRGALKDLDRQFDNNAAAANIVTSIIDTKDETMLDLFKRSASEPKLKEYIKNNSDIFYLMPSLLNQPKALSIHACAIIVSPSVMRSQEWFPVRKQNGLIVTYFSGGELDDAGFLKQDILGIKQLSKFSDILSTIESNGKEIPDIFNLPDDPEVYRYFSNGWNGDVFQMGTDPLSAYTKYLKPDNIEDLIATVSLYRPGPMENNYHNIYVKCKNEGRGQKYLWGTEEITKDTYGILCLDGNSNISTKKGIKKLKDVKVGDRVINEDGKYDIVTKHYNMGYKDTVKIRGSFGEELILTHDHRVLTQYGWVEAKDLDKKKHLIKCNWANSEKIIENEFSKKDWLIGFFIAEGSAKSTPSFTVGSEDIANKVIATVKEVYPTSYPYKLYRKNVNRAGDSWHVFVKFSKSRNNGFFSKDFKENLFTKDLKNLGLWNKTCYTKRLPKSYSMSMISGLIEGDACLSTNTIKLCNKELSYDLYLALQSYRINSSYFDNDSYHTVSFANSDKYMFNIYSIDRLGNFNEYVPTSEVLLNRRIFNPQVRKRYFTKSSLGKYVSKKTILKFDEVSGINHGQWCKINSIVDGDNINVFDITVKDKHSFTSGGLIVHNCYQEQIMSVCKELGGLTDQESDDVRRAMGKKNLKYLSVWEDRIREGYLKAGATNEQFDEAWSVMIEFAKYSFNRSHAAAYAKTGYICQWLKVNYPLEYWTVALTYADEIAGLKFMSEIFEAKGIEISPPDVNNSDIHMVSNNDTNTIFWGIESIKGIGEATAEQIIDIRRNKGDYTSLEDFIEKNTFTGSKVKKQTFEALITSGAFDILYNFGENINQRAGLLNSFREIKKVKISNPSRDIFINGSMEENWWWTLYQKKYTGIAFMDFKKLVKEKGFDAQYCSNRDLTVRQHKGAFRSFGGYVMEIKTRRGAKGAFAFLTIENNYKIYKLIMWSDEYERFKAQLKGIEKSFILFDAELKYEGKWDMANVFTLKENSNFITLT